VVSIVRKNIPVDDEWKKIVFMSFHGFDETIPVENSYFKDVIYYKCVDIDHMHRFYNLIIERGGEGIVLQDPMGTDWKKKPVSTDEAIVLGWLPGKGKFDDGLAGKVIVDWKGLQFTLALPIASLRKNPPCIGSQVTFSYRGSTKDGIPRFATFLLTRDYE